MLTGLIIGGIIVTVLFVLFAGRNTQTIATARSYLIAAAKWIYSKIRPSK